MRIQIHVVLSGLGHVHVGESVANRRRDDVTFRSHNLWSHPILQDRSWIGDHMPPFGYMSEPSGPHHDMQSEKECG